MSFLYNFFNNLFSKLLSYEENIVKVVDEKDDDDIQIIQYMVTLNQLNSVKLKKPEIQKELKPYDKVDLKNLNNSQLKEILNVKLNHVDINHTLVKKEYQQRHPVLKELLEKNLKK